MILCLCTLDYYSSNISVTYLQLGLLISSYLAVYSFPNAFPKQLFCIAVFQCTSQLSLLDWRDWGLLVGCFSSWAKILLLCPRIRLKVSLAANFPLFLTCTGPPSSKELLGFQFCSAVPRIQPESETDALLGCWDTGVEVVQDRSRSAGIVWMGAMRKMDKENENRGVNTINFSCF